MPWPKQGMLFASCFSILHPRQGSHESGVLCRCPSPFWPKGKRGRNKVFLFFCWPKTSEISSGGGIASLSLLHHLSPSSIPGPAQAPWERTQSSRVVCATLDPPLPGLSLPTHPPTHPPALVQHYSSKAGIACRSSRFKCWCSHGSSSDRP